MKKIILASIFLFLISGCATVTDIYEIKKTQAQLVFVEFKEKFDNSLLVLDKELRVYKYDGGVVLDRFGEKVSDRKEAKNILTNFTSEDLDSLESSLINTGYYVYGVPNLYFTWFYRIALWVVDLPFNWLNISYKNRYERKLVYYYEVGLDYLNTGNTIEARSLFDKSLLVGGGIKYDSDVLYWIAKSFEAESNTEKALEYHRRFLVYSLSKYPKYFKDYNEKYQTEDNAELSQQFTVSEKYIKEHS